MDRVMKFVLKGKPLDTTYDGLWLECFSDKIRAFLEEHPNEAVYVSMNKATAIKMYTYGRKRYDFPYPGLTDYETNLKKIIREFEINTFGKEYKCIAYIGPNEDAINKAIEDTVIGAGRAVYTLDLRPLNGYIHKPIRRNCDD